MVMARSCSLPQSVPSINDKEEAWEEAITNIYDLYAKGDEYMMPG